MPMAVLPQHTRGIGGSDDSHAAVPWRHRQEQSHGQAPHVGHLLGSPRT